jgi:hypothetical protein
MGKVYNDFNKNKVDNTNLAFFNIVKVVYSLEKKGKVCGDIEISCVLDTEGMVGSWMK